MNTRGQLLRLRRLEAGNTSPILKIIGSVESFEERITVEVAAGHMCPIDGPFLAKCVRKWVTGTMHHRSGNITDSWALPTKG